MKKSLLLLTLMVFLTPWALKANELTVYDGTATTGYVPAYVFYFDDFTRSQHVIPASDLASMANGTITAIKYYTTSENIPHTTESDVDVYLKVVDYTILTALEPKGNATIVYQGKLNFVAEEDGGSLTITLQDPFFYEGGNLLVGIENTTDAGYKNIKFYGQDGLDYGVSWSGYNSSSLEGVTGTDRNFLPKTTFTYYEGGSASTCTKPNNLVISNITNKTADFAWTSSVGSYVLEYKKADVTYWTVVSGLTSESYSLTGLAPSTEYSVRVKAVCGSEDESGYNSANFTTAPGLPVYESFASSLPMGWERKNGLLSSVMEGEELSNASVGWYFGSANGVFDDHARINIYGSSCKYWLVMPSLLIDNTAIFTFDLALTAYSGSLGAPETTGTDDKFVVLISTDDMASWTILRQWDNAGSEYVFNDIACSEVGQHIEFDLSSYIGQNVRIAFYVESTESNADNNLHIDNVIIDYVSACAKPTNLAVNYIGGTTAEVSWAGDATAWNMKVNGTPVNAIITSPFTLSNLELATTYSVEVQAVCGSETSDWGSVNFTTDQCLLENKCELTFVLHDSYGDGWNGNAIKVVDVATSEIIASMEADAHGMGSASTDTKKLGICDGRAIQFVWVSGGYPEETSYEVYDANGDEIFSGAGAMSALINYTIDCAITDCKIPTDLAASEIGPHSAKLSWTEKGAATAWKLAYKESTATDFTEVDAAANPFVLSGLNPETNYIFKVRPVCDEAYIKWSHELSFTTSIPCPAPSNMAVVPAPTSAEISWTGFSESYDIEWATSYTPSSDASWLQYDNGEATGNIGTSTAATWQFGVMYPASSLSGFTYLNKVAFFESNSYEEGKSFTISIYQGGDAAPETLISSEEVNCTASMDMREVMLQTPVTIDPTRNLWIIFTTTTITYPMAICAMDDANGRWVYYNDNWNDLGSLMPSYATNSFMIRGLLDNVTPSWTTVSNVESPYTINGLAFETDYVVRVKGDCGAEGESNRAMTSFSTTSSCPDPIVSVEPSARYANVSWIGYSDNYNVRYRETNALCEDFENGLGEWTTIDADGDTYTWHLLSELPTIASAYATSVLDWQRSGEDAIISASFYNGDDMGALTPDNWLVSPQVTLGGSISFYAKAGDANYPEDVFGVFVSTTGNTDPNDFQLVAQWTMDGNGWHHYNVDLSAYSGEGYVAIRHFDCTDQYILVIDDIKIISPIADGNSWSDILNTTAKSITLNNLTPATFYDVQVQGVCGDDETAWVNANFLTASVYELTISAAKYATFYEKDHAYVLPEGVDGYVFSLNNTPKLALAYEAGDTVAADIPLVLHHDNAGTYELIYTESGEGLAYGLNNDLIGVQEAQEIEAASGYIYYVLSTAKPAAGNPIDYESVGFYWPNADGKQNFYMPAHRAYLEYLESTLQGGSGAPSFLFDENNATSLDNLKGAEGTVKFIYNGHIYIMRDSVIYDATGRKVRTL